MRPDKQGNKRKETHAESAIGYAILAFLFVVVATIYLLIVKAIGARYISAHALLFGLIAIYAAAPYLLLKGIWSGLFAIVRSESQKLLGLVGLVLNVALAGAAVYLLFYFPWNEL